MLTKLQIRNFRKNERLGVRLGPLTVFRGPSASGKSSLIGALKWVLFNQPSGTGFIHWDHKFTAVRLQIDKHHIVRKRSQRENSYQLDDKRLVAFGTGVPKGVSSISNVSSLNVQRQHAGPFWFQETAGEVSKRLNAIVNLDLIDTTLANINKERRDTTTKVVYIESQVREAREEKRKLKYITHLDAELRSLEEQQRSYVKSAKRIGLLERLRDEAVECKEKISLPIPDIKSLTELYEKWEDNNEQIDSLVNLLGAAELLKIDIQKSTSSINEIEKEVTRLMGKRCPLCGNQLKKNT